MQKKTKDMNENIYDLTKIGGKSKDIQVDNISAVNYDAQLSGYKIIETDQWNDIPNGTHVKYLRRDGEFRKGGYITNITNAVDMDGNNTTRFDLVSNYSPSAIKWSLFSGSVEKIWGKDFVPLQNVERNNTDLTELTTSIKYCTDAIELIKKDIQKINNEQMRIINLIKNLHNIK